MVGVATRTWRRISVDWSGWHGGADFAVCAPVDVDKLNGIRPAEANTGYAKAAGRSGSNVLGRVGVYVSDVAVVSHEVATPAVGLVVSGQVFDMSLSHPLDVV